MRRFGLMPLREQWARRPPRSHSLSTTPGGTRGAGRSRGRSPLSASVSATPLRSSCTAADLRGQQRARRARRLRHLAARPHSQNASSFAASAFSRAALRICSSAAARCASVGLYVISQRLGPVGERAFARGASRLSAGRVELHLPQRWRGPSMGRPGSRCSAAVMSAAVIWLHAAVSSSGRDQCPHDRGSVQRPCRPFGTVLSQVTCPALGPLEEVRDAVRAEPATGR